VAASLTRPAGTYGTFGHDDGGGGGHSGAPGHERT
jgi:hypothetical protein